MAFLHVFGRKYYRQKNSRFLKAFGMLKFKMKLSYECWVQNLTIQRLMLQAVKKTVDEL